MSGMFGGTTARSGTLPARTVLTALMSSVGAAGLAAAEHDPGLLALVDQHVAAVRESLADTDDESLRLDWFEQWRVDVQPVSMVALAGYAEGIRDAAMDHGWEPPAPPIDWSKPDWVLVRLLAVCALARDAGLSC
jgi:hypothetical protein